MIYIRLFYEFLKVGLFTIGGGLATIPYLKDLAERSEWFTVDFITDMLALSESTPGPIGINMATYVGIQTAGLIGSIISTVGIIVPSIIVVILVSKFFNKFKNNKAIEYSLLGVRPTVTALIAAAGIEILFVVLTGSPVFNFSSIISSENFIKLILFFIIFYLIRKYNRHPIFYILLSGVIGIILRLN